MNIDNIFLLFENTGKYFPTYEQAYFNSKKPMMDKTVKYVFTPTMCSFKRVGEIERHAREYFNRVADCDFYDIFRKEGSKQLKIIGEC